MYFFQFYRQEIDALPTHLADKVELIPECLKDARANSTMKTYSYGFERWKKWALDNSLGQQDILPAKPFHFALYLCSIMQFVNSDSTIISAFYSIKCFHDLYGLKSPTESLLVKNILESAKRKLSQVSVKKESITPDILTKIYEDLYEEGNIKNQRIICACILAYAGFLRSNELLNIKSCDLVFDISHVNVFIESSKTDQYKDGAWVPIAKTNSKLCPVSNLIKYLNWAKIKENSDTYIFCRVMKTKDGYELRNCDKHISYTTLRELFVEAFEKHVCDITKYGLHSLRSGGATSAANSGTKDRLFKRHGRWLSDRAKDGYIKDCLQERLSVSLSLGL